MNKLKKSPEELEAASFKLHALIQERSRAEIQAVKEMLKHPLSLKQMQAQIKRADDIFKLRFTIHDLRFTKSLFSDG
jgi:hypothetical protein